METSSISSVENQTTDQPAAKKRRNQPGMPGKSFSLSVLVGEHQSIQFDFDKKEPNTNAFGF